MWPFSPRQARQAHLNNNSDIPEMDREDEYDTSVVAPWVEGLTFDGCGPLVQSTKQTFVKRQTFYEEIDMRLYHWMRRQHMFFICTAPVKPYMNHAHVSPNISPKSIQGTLAVLGPNTLAYLDSYGAGVETISHLEQTGNAHRMCLMMCSFDASPLILRFHGEARAVLRERDEKHFETLRSAFALGSDQKTKTDDYRAIIVIHCDRIFDGCGFGVPLFSFLGHREAITNKWCAINTDAKNPASKLPMRTDVAKLNALTWDGLPGPWTLPPFSGDKAYLVRENVRSSHPLKLGGTISMCILIGWGLVFLEFTSSWMPSWT
jgi:hypothetical protein